MLQAVDNFLCQERDDAPDRLSFQLRQTWTTYHFPPVSGFADNDLRLIGHTVFRDERDSHSPASESPEQPAKIAKAQFLVVDVNDQFARLVVVKVATQHVTARYPLVGSFRITDLRLSGHVLAALKTEGLLNESIGPGYIDRHWPPAFKDNGSWPLGSLRQSFLNGTLTRLLDLDRVLRTRIIEFVAAGEFGLASGSDLTGGYRRVWFGEDIDPVEIAFEAGVYLLAKAVAAKLKSQRSRRRPGLSPRRKVRCLRKNPAGQPSRQAQSAPF